MSRENQNGAVPLWRIPHWLEILALAGYRGVTPSCQVLCAGKDPSPLSEAGGHLRVGYNGFQRDTEGWRGMSGKGGCTRMCGSVG